MFAKSKMVLGLLLLTAGAQPMQAQQSAATF